MVVDVITVVGICSLLIDRPAIYAINGFVFVSTETARPSDNRGWLSTENSRSREMYQRLKSLSVEQKASR